MSLPSLATPTFKTSIPSTGEEIRFRPFLVKEEKILYMTLEGGDTRDTSQAVAEILTNCVSTPGFDPTKLASFDIEYLFLMLRAKSVGEVVNVNVLHTDKTECSSSTEVEINLDEIKVVKTPDHKNEIDLGDGVGMKLKYPNIFSMTSVSQSEIDKALDMISSCIVNVWDDNQVYDDFTREEALDFVSKLSKKQFDNVLEFFNTMPKLSHKVKFHCDKCGKDDEANIEGLQSFFG